MLLLVKNAGFKTQFKYTELLSLIFVCIFCISIHSSSYSQTDSLKVKKDTLTSTHSATKATIMSALLPGLGQFYNKKYWKVPLVYAGLGVTTYFAITNSQKSALLKKAYGYRTDGDPTTIDYLYANYSDASILSAQSYYQRNYELSCIIGVLIYLLNLIDASVDANLFDFSVKDDITFHLEPSTNYSLITNNIPISGFKLTLKF